MTMDAIRAAIDCYHELVMDEHLDTTRERLGQLLDRRGVDTAVTSYPILLRPRFVAAPAYDRLMGAATLLVRALRIATERLVHDRSLLTGLGFPAYLLPILDIDRDHGAPTAIGRFDGIRSADGSLHVIEFNSEPEGLYARVDIDEALLVSPLVAAFSRRFRFRHPPLFDLALEAILADHEQSGGSGPPGIAVVRDDDAPPLLDPHRRYLYHAAARGCRVVHVTAAELDYRDRVLSACGVRIDRLVLGSWASIATRPAAWAHLFQAIGDGAVRVLHGVSRGLIASYKHTFELLSDPEHREMFSPEQAAALTAHVPWTRVVRERTTSYQGRPVDLVRLITDHRERFVLKPSGGSGGQGVLLGWQCAADAWTRTVKRALAQHTHVVQERVDAERDDYPVWDGHACELVSCSSDLSPLVWNSEHGKGCMSRVSAADGVVNVALGAWPSPVWVIDAPA